MKRRILTLLLTLVMVLSLLPGTALAVNDSSSAPAVTYADLADINGTALVPDGAGENTELTVADAVRALLLWTGMTEQQLGSFPDDYLAQARSMGMIDADTDADAPCTLAAYRQMKAVADQMYDALHADKLQPLYMNGMAQPIFPYTTGEVTEGYSNDESDIIRYCVYVETNYDTDDDGKLDLVKALVQIPRAAMEGNYKAATIYEARPYITGCNESMNPGENLGSEGPSSTASRTSACPPAPPRPLRLPPMPTAPTGTTGTRPNGCTTTRTSTGMTTILCAASPWSSAAVWARRAPTALRPAAPIWRSMRSSA